MIPVAEIPRDTSSVMKEDWPGNGDVQLCGVHSGIDSSVFYEEVWEDVEAMEMIGVEVDANN